MQENVELQISLSNNKPLPQTQISQSGTAWTIPALLAMAGGMRAHPVL